jgi:hypothetical protein
MSKQTKKTLPGFDIDDIRSWGPCEDPVDYYGLPEGWHGNALDALAYQEVQAEDRLGVVLRPEALPEPLLSEVIVAIVRETPLADGRTVGDLLTDQRSLDALEIRLKRARGEIDPTELKEASNAAWEAAWEAAEGRNWAAARAARAVAWAAQFADETAAEFADWAADEFADWAADEFADWAADEFAAKEAAREDQVEIARRVIREYLRK